MPPIMQVVYTSRIMISEEIEDLGTINAHVVFIDFLGQIPKRFK